MASGSFLGIGEVARAAGLSVETVRYYESAGLLSPERDDSGRRRYSTKDQDALAVINALRGAGFGIRVVREVIGAKRADDSPAQRLEAGLGIIEELSRRLDERQAALDEARALCDGWHRELLEAKKALASRVVE
ncbi:MerR family transcriptional regulator [Tessaracoccus sp. OS52]|uniref:MerR family transcriptional regulator n=1 Tax=Tessaracoccus sp. OS52 TaxID=2886691 RepID=UPI001D10859F|nr:MerR family transcriptional regulator [Tessaracoccus sp. OS52]MCC2594439.1 MerR family transcriptional regulator [Tessaracoccus sp. OS52]